MGDERGERVLDFDKMANIKHPLRFIAVAALVVLYVAGSLFFSSHFLPGTSVNADDASWRSPRVVTSWAEERMGGSTVHVDGAGLTLDIPYGDIDLSFDAEGYSRAVGAKTPGWTWPIALLLNRSFTVEDGIAFDEGDLAHVVETGVEQANKQLTTPKSASIYYAPASQAFVADPETAGTALDAGRVADKVAHTLRSTHNTVQLDEGELIQPTLVSSTPEFAAALDRANSLADLNIPLLLDGTEVEVIDHELIRSWIVIGDDYQVTGDLDEITDWCMGTLSSKIDTVGSIRTYTRPDDGKKITIYDGTYGWNIDGQSLAPLIVEHIEQGSSEPIEIPLKSKAAYWGKNGPDWGKRYIDVDLKEQYVRMFDENGKLVFESECVTGDKSEGRETVSGVFSILDKKSPYTLVGLDYDHDGEPDYKTDVTYWMPFYDGYGFHDAVWRDSFEQDTFQYDGSHGCVNLPAYAAKTLYKLVKVGDPVVVHE